MFRAFFVLPFLGLALLALTVLGLAIAVLSRSRRITDARKNPSA